MNHLTIFYYVYSLIQVFPENFEGSKCWRAMGGGKKGYGSNNIDNDEVTLSTLSYFNHPAAFWTDANIFILQLRKQV